MALTSGQSRPRFSGTHSPHESFTRFGGVHNVALYLNLDGVLHPNDIRFNPSASPTLGTQGHSLFENVDLLTRVLSEYDNLNVVLNTWWTYHLGLPDCMRQLPEVLAERVVGTTLRHASAYLHLPNRIDAATESALASGMSSIILLDHANARYGTQILARTLLLDPSMGLREPRALDALRSLIIMTAYHNPFLASSKRL